MNQCRLANHVGACLAVCLGLSACAASARKVVRPSKASSSAPIPRRNPTDKQLTPFPQAPFLPGLDAYQRKIGTESPLAQAYFDQGLMLLQGFNHFAASRAFEAAIKADSQATMAYVGLALANGPHINRSKMTPEQTKKAWSALERASRLKNMSEKERDWLEALSTRYTPTHQEERKALDQAYAAAMRKLWKKYPKDADIGALFAESVMDLRPWDLWAADGSPQPGTEEVIATLKQVLSYAPDHPLALHLFVHAVEASPSPQDGIEVADRLRDLVKGHGHLLHMPSHIDAGVGRWNLGADTNQRAMDADRAQVAMVPEQDFYGLYMSHNHHMFIFMAMMAGRSEEALREVQRLVDSIEPEWANKFVGLADGFYAMPAEVMMRFGKWEEILELPERPKPFVFARALRHYARGVAYAATLEPKLARKELHAMRKAAKEIPRDRYFGANRVQDLVAVALQVLEGEVLYREEKVEAGLSALEEAVAKEDALVYDEPPGWIQPVRHALGAALLQQGRAKEAEKVYRDDLRHKPHNGWGLWGLSRALDLQGKTKEAQQAYDAHKKAWRRADIELKTSCLCLPGV